MKNTQTNWDLLTKYITWAKYDWAELKEDKDKDIIYVYDHEENRKHTSNYLIELILDNGMLDECYTQEEIKKLSTAVPKEKFKKEIKLYIKKEK